MSNHRTFSAEFKAEAVGLVVSSGRSVVQVSADIGVNEGTLGNWVRIWKQEQPASVAERGPVEWAEYKRLQAENVGLKREIDFLGKVSAFFAAKQR